MNGEQGIKGDFTAPRPIAIKLQNKVYRVLLSTSFNPPKKGVIGFNTLNQNRRRGGSRIN